MKKKHLFALLLSGMLLLPASSVARATENEGGKYIYGFFLECGVHYRYYDHELDEDEFYKEYLRLEKEICGGNVGGEGEIH